MRWFSLLILAWLILPGTTMSASQKTTYGYVEKVAFVDKKLSVSAKLDTGAKSASLSAIKIKEVEKQGKPFLSFIVPTKQGEIPFTCEYVGKVSIKSRADEGHSPVSKGAHLRRPVVLVSMKLGEKTVTLPVNLTNRKRFIYPLLLGRDAINAFNGIVDPSTSFTVQYPKAEKHES